MKYSAMVESRFSSLAAVIVTFMMQSMSIQAGRSVIEFPTCGRKFSQQTSVCISADSELITDSMITRTDIECITECQRRLPSNCTSVYRNLTDGMCHLINDVTGKGLDTCSPGGDSGTLYEVIERNDSNNCGGRKCLTDQVCVVGCHNKPLLSPMCLADDRGVCNQGIQFLNARHYWNDMPSDSISDGSTWFVTYPKLRKDTGLRVIQHVNIKSSNSGGCSKYFLTFNGNKCSDPGSIEMLDISNYTEGVSYRGSDVDGTCWGLPMGGTVVDSQIGTCEGYSEGDGYMGWNSVRSTIIMEVVPMKEVIVPEHVDISCPSLITFNYQYYLWDDEQELHFNLTDNSSKLIKQVFYTKTSSNSSLRIKYNSVSGVLVDQPIRYCAKWFIAINGTICNPNADYLVYQATPYTTHPYYSSNRRTRTVEGICDNALAEGRYSIEVWVRKCDIADTPLTAAVGGFGVPSRIHVEEVRLNQTVDAFYEPDHGMYKSMVASMECWHSVHLGQDTKYGEVITTYKEFSDTGLRLSASGSHRSRPSGEFVGCGRWYFMINGSECQVPGRIEAIASFDNRSNVHQPMQTSGVCHGLDAGLYEITYSVGHCNGYNQTTRAYTGFRSSFHIYVEELRVDLVKSCEATTSPINCDDN